MICNVWCQFTIALWEFTDAGGKWPLLKEAILVNWKALYQGRAEHVLTCPECIAREALDVFYGTTRNQVP